LAEEAIRRHGPLRFAIPFISNFNMAQRKFCAADRARVLLLLEDRVLPAAPAGSKPPQMASVHSTWTRNERIRQVIEGRRHLGQQVMEMVFLSREPLSPADAESHLGAVVGDVVVLREPEKLEHSHPGCGAGGHLACRETINQGDARCFTCRPKPFAVRACSLQSQRSLSGFLRPAQRSPRSPRCSGRRAACIFQRTVDRLLRRRWQ
jgi:hypothetical protein